MKNFIKSLELRRSDLFLLLGFLPFAIFLIFGQLFMQFQNPNDVALPLWAGIVCLAVMVICWGYYLYLEVYLSKDKYNLYIAGAFFTLLLINIITIIAQPSLVHENVIIRYREDNPELVGQITEAIIQVSDVHKFMFIGELVGTIVFIYIGLFVFPRRFKSLLFIKYLGYGLFALLFVMIIYGYIADFDKYVAFFKHILNIDRTDPDIYHKTVTSFIIHRNAYGMCMMLGIIFCFINHAIEKKWFYYLFMGIFYINMIFSLCKTGLLVSIILIIIYVVYRLIVTYKENKKRNTIALIVMGSIFALAILAFGVSYLSKGKVLGFIYEIVNSMSKGGQTLDFRNYIWDNTYQLLRDGNWLVGRGFGVINLLLQPMNIASHEEKVFPTHSAYVGLLAEGGILFLLAFLALLVYVGVIAYRCFKKNPGLTLAIYSGALAFIIYSFIETIHYLVYIFLFPIMVLYYISKEEPKVE
ncbi:MAG: hypothetical protein J5666_08690 [Bacilli bacterium]|nr:hypothetical protein [Bacilli bacterium]